MELSELILSSRDCLARFSYAEYPGCFADFSRRAEPLLEAMAGEDPEESAARLIADLERRLAGLPRRKRREAAFEAKQVLSLFLGPAAQRSGPEAAAFLECLCRQWNGKYPRNTFLLSDFDTLMKGFDSNVLGLTLRKSK